MSMSGQLLCDCQVIVWSIVMWVSGQLLGQLLCDCLVNVWSIVMSLSGQLLGQLLCDCLVNVWSVVMSLSGQCLVNCYVTVWSMSGQLLGHCLVSCCVTVSVTLLILTCVNCAVWEWEEIVIIMWESVTKLTYRNDCMSREPIGMWESICGDNH